MVGTNGKSSTVRMIAAILERHGLRAGAYLSPHLASFSERVRVSGRDLDDEALAAAVERAAHAAELVDRTLDEGDRVTQFEVLTAAAYGELAARGVDVAVVEAGLGGRYDATNVIPSRVQVLTNVGLEHTRWLGPTLTDIAREKLAVVRDGGALVVGGLAPEAEAEARAAAARHGARLVRAPADAGVALAARGAYQRRNFALARAAAEAFLGTVDETAVHAAAAEVTVPGRFELVGAIAADDRRRRAQPQRRGGARRIVAGARRAAVARRRRVDPRRQGRGGHAARAAARLSRRRVHLQSQPASPPARHARVAGAPARVRGRHRDRGRPRRALERARVLAGPTGVVLATGSIYLVAALASSRRELSARAAMNDDDVPHFLPMIALVAVIVALVILVFFGIGYVFGRLFL